MALLQGNSETQRKVEESALALNRDQSSHRAVTWPAGANAGTVRLSPTGSSLSPVSEFALEGESN